MEQVSDRCLTPRQFYFRLARFASYAMVLGIVSLIIGMVGFRLLEDQTWPEAFLNAAMLLSAMGPVGEPNTDAGKIFAGCYALYCGLVFLFTVGLLVTPVAHRLLHVFHADPDDESGSVAEK